MHLHFCFERDLNPPRQQKYSFDEVLHFDGLITSLSLLKEKKEK
mgnify:CR=1 FL=1